MQANKQYASQPASQVNHENRHVGKGKNNCSYWQKVYLAKARRAKEKKGKTVLHTTSFHSKNNNTNKHPNKQNPIHNFENELKRCAWKKEFTHSVASELDTIFKRFIRSNIYTRNDILNHKKELNDNELHCINY